MGLRLILIAALGALLATAPALAAKVTLPGQVTYRERIALPQQAVLRLQLIDQTQPSAAPRLDVEGAIGNGQVPLSFALTFEDSLIVAGHTYALIATISAGGGMLFRNFEPYVVDPLKPAAPVVIVTSFVGRIEDHATSREPSVAGEPDILESTWKATSIGGQPAVPRSTASLQIGADMRAGGKGGCNSWYAQAEIDGDSIRLGAITSTPGSCQGDDARNAEETAYYAALVAAVSWRIEANQLTLYDAAGRVVLTFTR
jgi:putative lipoprotein